ncbi:PD-(D/E)XK nuclease family protein [Cyclobacterium sp. 1_MG-2023]|uniref:PD-(D/E)XK nuclease family protein n=1 Tax=Cyclobacterium sp. 1_MG-2023 TaxID=3062681 RepID=UPI0026E2C35A|nr:PD-(D/E)XK nuclease family protein [Cyclobacterium sp. 1_MG-2023]MDO6436571.1 PD-(D/E)XK nuclease family protein [Cyclobacterium sp. 1_MG-2023]
MEGFLKRTAAELLQRGLDVKNIQVVLPNRRAGLFFTKYLGQLVSRPTYMPKVITIEDFFYDIIGKRPADKLSLIYELYKVFKSLSGSNEAFDRFYFWSEMILKDFNDLDQFLVSPEKLFVNLKEQKILESDWSFLSSDQIELIQAFWASFESRDRFHQEKFLRFWDVLFPLYQGFNSSLQTLGLAYGGSIYREVVENLDNVPPSDMKTFFVGFNAFTGAEEKLIKHYVKNFGAEIYWDIDQYYLNASSQEAGMFFRDYKKDKILGPTFPEITPNKIVEKERQVKTYAVPLKINQANMVGAILEAIPQKGENWEETVVILPDEQLLFPVLNLLPDNVNKVNVTMGYPVKHTPIFTFLEAVVDLQRYSKIVNEELMFYYKPVKELLSTVYLYDHAPEFSQHLIDEFSKNNTLYVSSKVLKEGGPLFAQVFQPMTTTNLMDNMLGLIKMLADPLEENSMERTYLFQCFKQMNRLKVIVDKEIKEEVNIAFLLRIFKQVFGEIKLPFKGEPLQGLQLMGVLESRNLDFKRVIICNMNEGSFPPSNSMNSMIPFNLRKAFGMPIQEQNDAIYAYTFYRLLHEAQEVHLLYTTAGEQGKVNEKSRYIHQLQIEMNQDGVQKEDTITHIPVNLSPTRAIVIEKDKSIMDHLRKYTKSLNGGWEPVSFSPSALNVWLDCRLKFYLSYIAGIDVPEEVQEEVDPAIFGNLVHKSLENLYMGYIERKKRKVLQVSDIEELKDFVYPAVMKAIMEQYFLKEEENPQLTGQLVIARDVLQKYLQGVLLKDKLSAPFEIISLEAGKKYRAFVPIHTNGEELTVALGGIIDRVDRIGDTVRLIDYKSGQDKKTFKSVESLFDRDSSDRNKAAMQTFFYGLLYEANFPDNQYFLKPALFNLRDIFKDDFNPYLQENYEYRKYNEVNDYAAYREAYVSSLKSTLEEIFDQSQVFDQTTDLKKCEYCPYVEICSR